MKINSDKEWKNFEFQGPNFLCRIRWNNFMRFFIHTRYNDRTQRRL